MGVRQIFFSDLSGEEVSDKMGKMVITFSDGRRGSYELDITDEEAEEFAKKGRHNRVQRATSTSASS